MRKTIFHKLSKRQATSAAATPAKTSTSCETLDGLAERLGSFHESARALANCLQKRDVLRKTDQSMIEAAKCMFHKIAGRGKGRLGSSDATVTRRSLYRDQTQQTTMFAYRDIESESLSSLRGIERTNLYIKCQQKRHCRNLQPVYRSKLSRMILGSSSSCRYLSITLENGNTNSKCRRSLRQLVNLLYAEAEKMGKIRNFRMYIGPGSDGSSADKVSIDLKFNPWDTAPSGPNGVR